MSDDLAIGSTSKTASSKYPRARLRWWRCWLSGRCGACVHLEEWETDGPGMARLPRIKPFCWPVRSNKKKKHSGSGWVLSLHGGQGTDGHKL